MNEEGVAWLDRHWDQYQYFVPPTFYDPDTAADMESDQSEAREDPCGRGEITPEEWDRLERQQRGETG